jgi:GDPmannose 4,6-dehydratase
LPKKPFEGIKSIAIETLNILKAILVLGQSVCLYNTGSSEFFGDTCTTPANENIPFAPRSPYTVTKCTASLVNSYRKSSSLYACTGISFNNEPPATRVFCDPKIVVGARKIKKELVKISN